MDLDNLLDKIDEKFREFKESLEEYTKQINLKDIISNINFDPQWMRYESYKKGDKFDFLICQGHYNVVINEKELTLTGAGDIELLKINGKEIEDYYNRMISEIEHVRENGGYKSPF